MKIKPIMALKPTLKLKQILTPTLIQMLRTFQHSYLDLQDEAQKMSEDNVFLEIRDQDQLLAYANVYKKDKSTKFQMQDISDFAKYKSETENMYSYLVSQLDLENLKKKERDITLHLIENLNSRGFLENYDQVKQTIKEKFHVSDRKVHDILRIVQTFEPDGIGARSLKECLLIQIEQHQFDSEMLREILNKVVLHHLEDLANGDFDKIAKKLKIEIEGVKAVKDFMHQNLNPNPGSIFEGENFNKHLTPSFEVKSEGNRIILTNLEQKYGFRLSISDEHLKLLENPDLDADTRKYLREKLAKAKNYLDSLQKRYDSMQNLVSKIVEMQYMFLEKGPAYLEPLLQKQLARELELSSSTVSRIVSAKYIQTPYGIFALKQMCPRSHFGKTSERLKIIVKDLMQKYPDLSDQKLSILLAKDGINMARRTVTKYRHLVEMGNN
ncbi:RNA polymerase factor sigma-54 [Candidatus Margulisiibacteriota bacterium]